MQPITYCLSPIAAGIAKMLTLAGHSCTEEQLVIGMEAPWLFLRDGDCYRAGARLFRPAWMNLYTRMHGFHIAGHNLAAGDIPAFLRTQAPALLPLLGTGKRPHTMLFTDYSSGHYTFLNVKPEESAEPYAFSFSLPMLKRRLTDRVTIYTLAACSPEKADFLPLFFASLDALDCCQEELIATRHQAFTLAEFRKLHAPLFRTLLVDELPMAALSGDYTLVQELRLLNHDYRHLFTRLSPNRVTISERMSYASIGKCVTWLKEDIVDRCYAHGASDEIMDAYFTSRKKHDI